MYWHTAENSSILHIRSFILEARHPPKRGSESPGTPKIQPRRPWDGPKIKKNRKPLINLSFGSLWMPSGAAPDAARPPKILPNGARNLQDTSKTRPSSPRWPPKASQNPSRTCSHSRTKKNLKFLTKLIQFPTIFLHFCRSTALAIRAQGQTAEYTNNVLGKTF